MIIIIVGESGAGKSTLMDYMINHLDFKLPEWYTTREPRDDDSDKMYNFMSVLDFLKGTKEKIIDNANVLYGNLYGTTFPEYHSKNYISVMDVEGLWKPKRAYGNNVVGVFLECNESERAYRMLLRGDSQDNVYYRLATDRTMFKGAFEVSDYKITSATPKEDVVEMLDIIKDIENEKGVKLIEV